MFRVLAIFILLFVAGCASHVPPQSSSGNDTWNVSESDYHLPDAVNGSLYRPGFSLALFQDKRAFRVGDILTVSLDEKTYSSKKANTQTDKESGLDLGLQSAANDWKINAAGKSKLKRGFNGSGSSTQQNQLTGSITVTVAKVLPNGILVIRGEKWLSLNQGDEYLRLKGLIRTDDIDNDNIISSQRIANAKIVYGGQGAVADSNSAGWLSRFFNSPWFPL